MPVVAAKSYIEYRKDAYWVKDTRISLDSIYSSLIKDYLQTENKILQDLDIFGKN
jgi:hypothetical protein